MSVDCSISTLDSEVRVKLENKAILSLALIPRPALSQGVRAGCIHLPVSVGPYIYWQPLTIPIIWEKIAV